MWHVADGDLHAYLDGALGTYPAEEADRIRGHLEQCEECRRRLSAEGRLREQAGSVLAQTDVETFEPPPFEEVRKRARARAGAKGSGPSRLGWLGWAASVTLALGTGWMLGRQPEAVLRGPVAEPSVATEAEREVDAVGSAFADGPPPSAEPVDLPRAAVAAAERPEEALADEDLEQRSVGAAAVPEVPLPTAAGAAAPPFPETSDALAARGDLRAAGAVGDRALPFNVAVPGLPVVRVEWTEFTPGVEGLAVQQIVDQDTMTIELRFLGLERQRQIPAGEPADLFGPLPDGVNQVIVRLGGESGWAALRGRLPRERLEGLLDRFR
jgi:hypothetical protein